MREYEILRLWKSTVYLKVFNLGTTDISPENSWLWKVSRAIPDSGGEDTDQSHALACDQLRFLGTTTPRGREPSRGFFSGGLERKAGSPVPVAGPGRPGAKPGGAAAGAGPSARGAGGACDHAARGRARSAARRRRRGEQWRPWPPERRVRCRCCCGGCWCRGSAAGIALAPAARAGSPSPSSHFPSPGSRPGRQVTRAVIHRLSQQCTLFLGTLTTEDKFFFLQEENFGEELSTRKGRIAIQRDKKKGGKFQPFKKLFGKRKKKGTSVSQEASAGRKCRSPPSVSNGTFSSDEETLEGSLRHLGELAHGSHLPGDHRSLSLPLAALALGGTWQLTASAQQASLG
ncbi:TPA: hypothetical protein BOS_6656 [Bos taurus]|nr:TPA: hypothetical protein BOS_6656 [Bos taurus]